MRLLWLATVSAAALAQNQPAERPRFEVASIKECKSTDRPPPVDASLGRMSMGCWSLSRVISQAYDLYASGKVDSNKSPAVPLPVEGGPDWMQSARFTIDAKAEGPVGAAMMRGPMMQTLLEERFHLKIHRETREMPGYVMTVAKGGPKLHSTEEGSCVQVDPANFSTFVSPNGKPWCADMKVQRNGSTVVSDARGMSLDVFARHLNPDHLPVINHTGLTGIYDIHLEWTVDDSDSTPPGAPRAPATSVFLSAVRNQLGLQLDSGKSARELLVVDHIERPSGN